MDAETWLLWLLADSQLPTGGFVASGGLEAALQAGLVSENAPDGASGSLIGFIRGSSHSQAHFALPFCSRVYEIASERLEAMASSGDDEGNGTAALILADFIAADSHHHAMLSSNRVAMRASAAQGGGLLSLFNRGYAQAATMEDRRGRVCASVGKELQRLARLGEAKTHWPTVFGFVCAALGVSLVSTQQLYLFQFVRQIFSAAIRLNLVGPLRAQTLQCDMHPHIRHLLAECAGKRVAFSSLEDMFGESAVYTEPVLELYQGMHDRLYSRIFNS
ncbi:hypothetical protein GGI04_002161 [Coemansia thaxteri]|uniref:Urease accessory protein UreF n=1 Tax=Coemansia thaxteri TaxID=2663907 RepID=A0A9W8BFP2_9FUNG|nr:hypothetical protein H4R26_002016 [Coemansia thaxteri]KAJ2005638.1 hypothetical protein GGI04_002161 [Coemansia thaxteri]KAJ2473076.1 hypothetical protein GGI02_001127 [Coemansia sp. RSA 2322]KAJ2484089.1 hypothetical protein EV174_002717 [Coemansia sp. RSA 2320]